GLGALENPVDVAGPTPIALSLVDAVGCKQAGLDISAFGADGRQPRGERELRDLHTLRKEQTVYRHDDGLRPLLAESIESRSQLAAGSDLLGQHRYAAGARGDIDALGEERHRRAPGIGQESDPAGAGNDLQCHLHQLTGYALDALRHPGHVAAWPRIAREEIRDACIREREADDRQRRRDAFERDRAAGRVGHQDVWLQRDQFLRQRLELFDVAVAMVDIEVATLRVAQAAQALNAGEVHVLLRAPGQE